MKEILSKAQIMLGDADVSRVLEGVELIEANTSQLKDAEVEEVIGAIMTLFHIDTFDRPDLQPAIEKGCELVSSFGGRVLSILLQSLQGSDLKVQLWVARCLGMMGAEAIEPMLAKYKETDDPYVKSIILFALGRSKCKELAEAAPVILDAFTHEHREIRDSAARTIGRMAEHLSPEDFSDDAREEIFTRLYEGLTDEYSGVRSKSARSIGKLAQFGYLTEPMKAKAVTRLKRIIGESKQYAWDKAYVVRKEAEEALTKL